ncbi:hypothetical protein GUITHDRAFT_93355 [Guillardia theta CCMP2712]|uniref:Uncharacterized protein n=1 Tax=Guillardia theta (strain CCMP2712) TaxID=905079 RepID=L1JLG2_GUITC|nr:hypothetical protein GUITHDRAFT_93355 [Guillardia theta CCMP2712]EKX49361.1 hypothetical protein GUITHDRAFT_93355 [Guillardia theta CCMP2712]|eukprot:XP_005836341.1 hypothetical protein GUITHDRAFT_93355 [Guillardia theta CCMP2712]
MQASQEQIAEMLMQMHQQCQFFEQRVKYDPSSAESFASWGSTLMHLAMVCEEQEAKKDYLKQSIEKLEKAYSMDDRCRTQDGELACFCLGNALYFNFFLERDDSKAESHLKCAKEKFQICVQREPTNISYKQMIDQLESAHEQRRAAHEHLARLEGKSEDERKVEIRNMQKQMLESVVENNKRAVEVEPQNAVNLAELAKSMFELAMLYQRADAIKLLREALSAIQKSIDLANDSSSVWVRAVLKQALSIVVSNTEESSKFSSESKHDFDRVLVMERDLDKRNALKKERELLDATIQSWFEWIQECEGSAGIAQKKNVGSGVSKSAVQAASSSEAHTDDASGYMVLVAGALLVAGAVWWFSRKRSS